MLINYFEKLLDRSKAEILANIFVEKHFNAKDLFTEEGKYCNRVGFIEKGLARAYYLDIKGNENTVCFSFDNMMMLDPVAFYTGERAKFTIELLEKSIVHVAGKLELEHLYNSDLELNTFGRKITEDSYIFMLNRLLERETLPAEERYQKLMKNTELFQKIPLKYLASYIGITDSSLSRIRKKIVQ